MYGKKSKENKRLKSHVGQTKNIKKFHKFYAKQNQKKKPKQNVWIKKNISGWILIKHENENRWKMS